MALPWPPTEGLTTIWGRGSESHASVATVCGGPCPNPSKAPDLFFSHPCGPTAACGSGSRSSGATPVSGPPPPSASSTPAGQPSAISRLQMQLHLRGLQNSTSDLRGQLQQLRKLQVPLPPGPRPCPAPSGPTHLLRNLLPQALPHPLLALPRPEPFTGPLSEYFLPFSSLKFLPASLTFCVPFAKPRWGPRH